MLIEMLRNNSGMYDREMVIDSVLFRFTTVLHCYCLPSDEHLFKINAYISEALVRFKLTYKQVVKRICRM